MSGTSSRCHVATLMKRMGIEAIYRKPNTSKPSPNHKGHHPRVKPEDRLHIPMASGFLHLAAVADWFSRRVSIGDLWLPGGHRLLCGDSTKREDVRRMMNGERAVLFASDPPYLVDYDGSNHPTRNKDWSLSYGVTWDDASQGAELYDSFIAAAVAEAITEDAAWYCWHASRRQAMLEACWEKASAFVHQQIIWVKDRGVLTRSHYLWKHEPCFMGWRRPNRPPKVAEETLPSTWEMPSFAKNERPDHPTPKPLDAFGIPMRQHVARGGLCYEPFSGSGSQIMAGEANGRRVYVMEISPAYVDVAIERWQAETGRAAILDGDGTTFAEIKVQRLGAGTDAAAA